MGSDFTNANLRLVLDIGTHKVLGLVTRDRPDDPHGGVDVLASCLVRHHGRAMRDGQVHDVPAVARTVGHVRQHLEKALGVTFTEAHIAAAGRTLRTVRGRAEQTHDGHVSFTEEMNRLLEWEAVANAQATLLASLEQEERKQGFYCIAHSVTNRWLDDDPIGGLVGQRGSRFAVEVLATFLPGAVVDALEGALTEAGLAMAGLTLEPIAVLEALVPDTMRHLNLVLVDIGAGTSDIALTGDGTVKAYAMVPEAGDAITEAVAKALLLDFTVADEAKREAAGGRTVRVENVLGEPVELTAPLLQEVTEEVTRRLAARIATEIGQWAGASPDAVLLVGGGSQTPLLVEALAEALDVPQARVAVRDRRAVRGVQGAEQLQGPDVVTALGIARLAAGGGQIPPVRVRVDGRPVCLFLPDRCTVREAARIAGLPLHRLTGRIGTGLTVTVNGELTVLPGTKGEAAPVHVNGRPASLDTVLQPQDEVQLGEARDGEPPKLRVRDLVKRWLAEQTAPGRDGRIRIQFENTWRDLPVWVRRNGLPAHPDEPVHDRDTFDIRFPRTAGELLQALGRSLPRQQIRCHVNGRLVTLPVAGTLLRNGRPVGPEEPVREGDRWDWEPAKPVTVRDAVREAGVAVERPVPIVLNGEPVTVNAPVRVRRNGLPAEWDEEVRDGDRLEVEAEETLTLYQILPYAGMGAAPVPGGRLILQVGGRPAGYTDPVAEGDEVTIRVEENHPDSPAGALPPA